MGGVSGAGKRRATETVDDALRELQLIIVVGKGGVGRTTVAASLARRAVDLGRRVLVVDIEGKHELARLSGGHRLTARPTPQTDGGGRASVDACTVAPDTALVEYLDDHGMRQISKRLVATGAVEVIATAAPGIKDLLVLGRIKALVNAGDHDLVIVDTPASGHAVSFLLGPRVLADMVNSGSIRRQADEVMQVLLAPTSKVVLVTLPEETPVNEAVETATALRNRVGVDIACVVVNGVLDNVPNAPAELLADLSEEERTALSASLTFARSRLGRQREQIRSLERSLTLPQVRLPLLPTTSLGPADIDHLAALLGEARIAGSGPVAGPVPSTT